MTIRRELPRVAWARQLHELTINNDGFAIVHGATGPGTIWLVADAPRGLLYGAYELHSYEISEASTAGVESEPKTYFAIRSRVRPLSDGS